MSDTLLLNSDAQPVSFLPLSTIIWQDAIKYMVLEKVSVLSWHDDWIVHSATWETRVPSVIMLKEYTKPKTRVRFSKSNIFLRDRYVCQYCNIAVNNRTATVDHVLPVSHGGKSTFENTVTSCSPCNGRKGNNKKIKPKIAPHRPTYWELADKKKEMLNDIRHPDWLVFLNI
jgi:5-methylcytosine-specific restriction endonuclease McrA